MYVFAWSKVYLPNRLIFGLDVFFWGGGKFIGCLYLSVCRTHEQNIKTRSFGRGVGEGGWRLRFAPISLNKDVATSQLLSAFDVFTISEKEAIFSNCEV